MKRIVKKIFKAFGYTLTRAGEDWDYPDMTREERDMAARALPFTMGGRARLLGVLRAVEYLSANRIAGDIIECGVWRGGSMMAAALALIHAGDTKRKLYLYDTFSGMSEPGESDVRFDGHPAFAQMRDGWCAAPITEVKRNMLSTGYPEENIILVEGKVEETIPATAPEQIALLRLDTDWYQSTRHELEQLYPRLSPGGILIIDDYGHWKGARMAVDEYFSRHPYRPFLHRLDYTARLIVKNLN